ncbi:hypothetical protein [Coleofasciculus sp. FACHB-1120]|nr:hypothetical protein [Coleofasciculus sp. FACHB-1120]MBD2741402.1 hypothetical protein [Coleofasciculus sp. FACHB-1120]
MSSPTSIAETRSHNSTSDTVRDHIPYLVFPPTAKKLHLAAAKLLADI